MSTPQKPSLLASILFHGATLGADLSQAVAASTPPKRRKGVKGGCTPCAAKAAGVSLLNKSRVIR